MFDRTVVEGGMVVGSNVKLKVKKRIYVDNTLPALNVFASRVASWFAGTASPATHIGFGTNKTLDRCEAHTSWTKGGDASDPTTVSTDFQEGSSSVGLGKDASAATTFNYSQTLASGLDLSGDDSFVMWLLIDNSTDFAKLDATSAVEIQLGNDSSNYYKLTLSNSDIYVGWQRIEARLWSDFTEEGTVDDTDIDYLNIAFTTNNATDTILCFNV